MLNPNAPNTTSNYERIENILTELKPDPQDFAGRIYPEEDVNSDIKQLDDYRHIPEYQKSQKRSDAKLLEKTFTDMAERGDWFSEEEAYGDDLDYLALITFPTSDIDDAFNHIDVIGMIKNEVTDHEVIPFAIDLTYNTDSTKMAKKFSWRHLYGKTKDAPEGISEFGESYMGKDLAQREILKYRPISETFRHGLKIPGFASAKYYEDKNNPWDPMYEKGRIEIMPRFIVGYSPDIADILSSGMPSDEYRKKYGETAYQKKKGIYKDAERRAKWCTLLECKSQASNIRSMLEQLTAEEIELMEPSELERAKKQITAMDTYFTKAVELATQKAQNNPEEIVAKEYADRDPVRQMIAFHDNNTYINKNR